MNDFLFQRQLDLPMAERLNADWLSQHSIKVFPLPSFLGQWQHNRVERPAATTQQHLKKRIRHFQNGSLLINN